jgi:hypothetical protein
MSANTFGNGAFSSVRQPTRRAAAPPAAPGAYVPPALRKAAEPTFDMMFPALGGKVIPRKPASVGPSLLQVVSECPSVAETEAPPTEDIELPMCLPPVGSYLKRVAERAAHTEKARALNESRLLRESSSFVRSMMTAYPDPFTT